MFGALALRSPPARGGDRLTSAHDFARSQLAGSGPLLLARDRPSALIGASAIVGSPGTLMGRDIPLYMLGKLSPTIGAAPVQSLAVDGDLPGTSGPGLQPPSALERDTEATRDIVLSPLLDGNGGTPAALGHAKGTPTGALEQYRTPQATVPKPDGQSTCKSAKVSPEAASSPVDDLVINYRDGRDPSPDGSALSARSHARSSGPREERRRSLPLARRLDSSTLRSAKPTPRSPSGSGSRGTIRSRRSPVSGSSDSSRRPDPPGICSPVEQRLEQQRLDALRKIEQRLEDRIRLAQSDFEQQLSVLKQQQGEQLDERTMRIVGEMHTDTRALEQQLAHVKNLALEAGARLNAQASALANADDRLNDLRVKQATHDLLFRQQVGLVDELQAVVGEHGTRLAGAEERLVAVEGSVEALKAEITRQLQVYRRQMQVGQVKMVKSKPELMTKACDLIKSLMDRFSDGGRRTIRFDLSHMPEIAGMLNARVQSSEPFGKKSRGQRTTLKKLELWDLYETKFSPDIERGPFHKADDMAIITAWNEKKSAREIGATVLPASGRGARDMRQMDSRIEWLKANAEKKYGEKMISKKKS